MGLLQQIIDGATDGNQPVGNLLRSVQVLAVRSRAVDLGEWVKKERDGYSSDDVLPGYRGPFQTRVLGHFTGPRGSEVQNVPMPRMGWPDECRELFEFEFRVPMAELEELVRSDQPVLSAPWSGDAIIYANKLVDKGAIGTISMHRLANARREVPRTLVVAAVDAVRNRVLDLALELEQVAPGLNEADGNPQSSREQVSAVYQTIVHAHNAYVGTNTATQQQVNIQVTPGDLDSLTRYLDGIRGLGDEDKKELVAAADAAKAQGPEAVEKDGRLKAALKKLGGMTGKVVQEGANVAVRLAIERWLGPPPA